MVSNFLLTREERQESKFYVINKHVRLHFKMGTLNRKWNNSTYRSLHLSVLKLLKIKLFTNSSPNASQHFFLESMRCAFVLKNQIIHKLNFVILKNTAFNWLSCTTLTIILEIKGAWTSVARATCRTFLKL
jgi:hypothetical protein